MGLPVGTGSARLAYRGYGNLREVLRAAVRYPWRGTRPDLPPPRSGDRTDGVAGRKASHGPVLAAHGVPDRERRKDVQVAWELHHDTGRTQDLEQGRAPLLHPSLP